MKVNKLGKRIMDQTRGSIKAFARNLGIPYSMLKPWCIEHVTPREYNMVNVDKIADALGISRQTVLNEIVAPDMYDVITHRGKPYRGIESELRRIRIDKGLSLVDVATLVGEVDSIHIRAVENGERNSFPSNEALKNYLDLMEISFTQFERLVREAKEERMQAKQAEPEVAEEKPVEPEIPEEKPVVTEIPEEIEAEPESEEKPTYRVVDLPEIESKPMTNTEFLRETMKTLYDLGSNKKLRDEILPIIYGKVSYEDYKRVEELLK